MDMLFSTEDLPEKDGFSYYREELSHHFDFHLVTEKPQELFFAQMRGMAVGNAAMSQLNTCAHNVSRSAYEIAQTSKSYLLVCSTIAGNYQFKHDGKVTEVNQGDLMLMDTTRPWSCRIQHSHQSLMVWLDRDALLSQLKTPDLSTINRLMEKRPLVGLLDGYLHSLAKLTPDECAENGDALIGHFSGLLALALGANEQTRETTGIEGLKAARLYAIRAYMEQELANPELSPALIAANFGISPRYLHMLFATTNTSFTKHLQSRRLEQCHRDLSDPAHATRNISEIAYRWGFNDLSHFGRCFRAVYGVSPREVRHLAGMVFPRN